MSDRQPAGRQQTAEVAESPAARFTGDMAFVIITKDGGPLTDHDGLGVIVFEKMSKFMLAWPKWLAPVDMGYTLRSSSGRA